MAIRKSEFSLALNQVATERNIPVNEVLDSIKMAVKTAYKKEYEISDEDMEAYEVFIDGDTGEAKIMKSGKDTTPPGFGRIAAQTAKQVIIQKIREAEKKAIVQHFSKQVGMVVTGRVIRSDGRNAYVDIGRAEAVLPSSEQIPGERYMPNTKLLFYLKEITGEEGHQHIILSRRNENLITELFKREVPELAQGVVIIKAIVREPGQRAKIAVTSKERGVDPIGSCVGQRGVRILSVISGLGVDEKIDIVQWSDDPETFIMNAIAPPKKIEISLNKEKKEANMYVDPEDLSLIIGREGQNIRLASLLTGYTLNALSKDKAVKKETPVEA